MRPIGRAGAAAAALAILAGAALVWFRRDPPPQMSSQVPSNASSLASGGRVPAAPRAGAATLYCEFTSFSDLTPLVGFLFRIEGSPGAPAYALVSQRERDGSEAGFGGGADPSPLWTFDGRDSPAAIRAPEDGTRINLYGYDPAKVGTYWFEAGLRSIRYRNLGGRCRHSA